MNVDNMLRKLLFTRFRVGKINFDFLEALLVVCITGVGFLLRTPFEEGLPSWLFLLAEWYLAAAAATLIWRLTGSRMRTLGSYSILMILPAVIAEGTILRGDACVGALLVLCGFLFLEGGKSWLFTIVLAGALLLDVRYTGLLAFGLFLWQREKIKIVQLVMLLAAGGARFLHSYRLWLHADYTLATFHWPNIYEIVGKETVQGQLVDPIALVGLFLGLGLLTMLVWIFGHGKLPAKNAEKGKTYVKLCLFFVLTAGYFLPYMDQSYGLLVCVLSVLWFFQEPREFPGPILLQIVAFAGYQECFNGVSMMPMPMFAVIQFLVMAYLGVRLLEEAGVISICSRKN